MRDSSLLFVYGSLRRDSGHNMGRWLAESADYHGVAWCEAARLYRVSWYPALVPAPGSGERVRGDLYGVPDALWAALDAFEAISGGPDDEYERRPGIVTDATGRTLTVWVYWWRREVTGLDPVAGGDWLLTGR